MTTPERNPLTAHEEGVRRVVKHPLVPRDPRLGGMIEGDSGHETSRYGSAVDLIFLLLWPYEMNEVRVSVVGHPRVSFSNH